MKMSAEQIATCRIIGSGLVRPFESVEDCVSRLIGIQAQAQQFAEISIYNRTREPHSMYSLFADNSLIKIWGHRMTVHIHTAKDWPLVGHMHGFRNNHVHRRWSDKKADYDRVMDSLRKLMEKGTVAKKEVSAVIQQTVPHLEDSYRDPSLIIQATIDGVMYAVAEKPNIATFRHRRHVGISDEQYRMWGKENRVRYLAEGVKRYFSCYGPATFADFCHWSGLTQAEARDSFNSVAGDLITVDAAGKKMFMTPGTAAPGQVRGIKLLGKFDPIFLSYADKSWIADTVACKAIWRPAAHVEAVILDGIRVAGTWRYELRGTRMNVSVQPLCRLSAPTKKKIAVQAEKLSGFMDKKLDKIVYL